MADEFEFDIQVKPEFIGEHSQKQKPGYAFSYTINITNTGRKTATLMARHWVITDANGKVIEVQGEGVIGEQPMLEPGQSFEYTSGAVIETPIGCMQGSYTMQGEAGEQVKVAIPVFSLCDPKELH